MSHLGVIEGFFGPSWKKTERLELPHFLKTHAIGFYIYAPKADPQLRKKWREPWSQDYLAELRTLVTAFQSQGVKFGVALSPFGLEGKLSLKDRALLEEKSQHLKELGIDILGVFFDDMHSFDGLAGVQLEVVELLKAKTSARVIFCPTYYTYDPILEKVFGTMPKGYIEDIGSGLASDVEIAWTGPKVISQEITREHLVEVSSRIRRKPFLWDNLFANDGPKNCKFIRFKPFTGRSPEALVQTSGWGINPMNQYHFSTLSMLSARLVEQGTASDAALEKATRSLCSQKLTDLLLSHQTLLNEVGLDQMDPIAKEKLLAESRTMDEPIARELVSWLKGETIVGSECLTD